MEDKREIMMVDEKSLKDKIYIIRDQQIMLDFELAEIYGYTTGRFNEQVTRNIEKFDSDFMFELTREEFQNLISQNAISSWGGRRKLPRAFTEQGIYMLMTVLKSDLATIQSKKLIRLFKSMKDYIIENQQLMITQHDYLALATKVNENSVELKEIKNRMDDMVTHADLSEFIKLFDSGLEHDEILILNGEPFKADLAYQEIYKRAKSSIIVVDDYIGTKTLQHLAHANTVVSITVISDNKAKPALRKTEYDDFEKENPGHPVSFLKTEKKSHDRYIILDYNTKNMKVYHCGASSKDAGVKKITTISEIKGIDEYRGMVQELLCNPTMNLK